MKLLFTVLILSLLLTLESNSQPKINSKIDSLINELSISKVDTNKAYILWNISKQYNRTNPSKGLRFANRSLALSKKMDWPLGIAWSYESIAMSYKSLNKYETAIEKYKKTLPIYEDLDSSFRKANIYINIGNIYMNLSELELALKHYNKSKDILEKLKNTKEMASLYGNIGVINMYQGDYPAALDYFSKAMKLDEKNKDSLGVAANMSNMSIIYNDMMEYDKALKYFLEVEKIYNDLNHKPGLAYTYGNIGGIYIGLEEYNSALTYLQKSLALNIELKDKHQIANNNGNIALVYSNLKDYNKSIEHLKKGLEIFIELGDKSGVMSSYTNLGIHYREITQQSNIGLNGEPNNYASLNKEAYLNESIDYLKASLELARLIGKREPESNALIELSYTYKAQGNFKESLDAYVIGKEIQDSIFTIESKTTIANLEAVKENLETKRKNELKDKEIAILNIEQEKQEVQAYAMIGGLGALGMIISIIFYQRRKSEALLLNILPATIAKRLKGKEKNIADDFNNASTVFIDLVGFTSFAKDKPAAEVVKVLNKVFHRLDDLVTAHGLEKIKTMGDGYMAAAGVPEQTKEHAKNAVNFAMAVRDEIIKFNNETGLNLDARLGIESGPVVAGVIGKKKFVYDLWGDSVNTASRMESTGLPGQIQITENVKNELELLTNSFTFLERAPIEVKGKGIMQTYFVERG